MGTAADKSLALTVGKDNDRPLTLQFFGSADGLRTKWEQLYSAGPNYPFQSYAWITGWLAHTGEAASVEPCFVLLEDSAGTPLALMPLGIDRCSGLGCLIWLGGVLADYQTAICSTTALQELSQADWNTIWAGVCATLQPLDAIQLERQPDTIGEHANPFVFAASRPHTCDAHAATLPDSLESLLKERRPAKWRSKERRKERRLAEAGEVRFVVATTTAEFDRMLPVMIQQKRRSYIEMGVDDIFADDGYHAFVGALTRNPGDQEQAVLCGLYIGDSLAATIWGLAHNNHFYQLLPTYERDELTRYSPGSYLLRFLFDWCIGRGINVYDFTAGDEEYKLLWCDRTLGLSNYMVGISLRGKLFVAKESLLRSGKIYVKNSPRLFELAKRLRTTIKRN